VVKHVQSRKIKMPVAVALSIARSLGIGSRNLPMGRPRKMVNPAIAPSAAICAELTAGPPQATGYGAVIDH